ncbi:hypothetical protein EBS43_11500 [bacterium]|jgi:hypothetical protein|nr:hypothetical protein [bacterium]
MQSMSVSHSTPTVDPSHQSKSQDEESENSDPFSHAASKVREDIERIVEEFNFQGVSQKIEEFGKKNPVGLAMTALALGVAVGFMIRKNPELRSVKKAEPRGDLTPVA